MSKASEAGPPTNGRVHGWRPGDRAAVVETSERAEADRHLAAPVEGPPPHVGRGAPPAPDGLSEDAPAGDETSARPPRVHAVNRLRYLVYCALVGQLAW